MVTESYEPRFIVGKDLNSSYLFKVTERLRMVCEKIKCQKDLEEDEWETVRWLHRAYLNGDYVVSLQRLKLTDEKAVDQVLFEQNVSKKVSGTDIADGSAKPNEEEK